MGYNPQLIRDETKVDVDLPDQSLMLMVRSHCQTLSTQNRHRFRQMPLGSTLICFWVGVCAVNGFQQLWTVPYSPIGLPVWSTEAQYSMSTCIFLVLSAQLLNSDSYCRQPMSWRGLCVIPSTRVRYFSGSEPIWVKLYLPAIGQSTGAGGFTVNKKPWVY